MPPDRYLVIGDPIEHSISPVMQQAALDRAGIPATYERLRVDVNGLRDAVAALRRREFAGMNVTIPHKRAIRALLDVEHDSARDVGAVNTVVREGGRLVGYNTDVDGFRASLERVGYVPGGTGVILGAGGAARAVVCVLGDLGVRPIVVSRDADRAAKEFENRAPTVPYTDLAHALNALDCTLLVNATPLGMPPHEERSPLPEDLYLRPEIAVIDLIYGRVTPFLRHARASGCATEDGLEMLVRQGAAAFQLWTGVLADVDAMRSACLHYLKEKEGKNNRCFVS